MIFSYLLNMQSHPSWVCGLKLAALGKSWLWKVTPFVGVWIETNWCDWLMARIIVTPFVGVWIETTGGEPTPPSSGSHPSWVCGLKLNNLKLFDYESCHTLRGCVD